MEQEIKTEENISVTPEELKELLQKNIELTQEIYAMTHKIKSYITFQKVVSFIYLFLIIMPIILGALFLPPLLKDVFSQYSELLNPTGGSFNIGSLLKQGTDQINK